MTRSATIPDACPPREHRPSALPKAYVALLIAAGCVPVLSLYFIVYGESLGDRLAAGADAGDPASVTAVEAMHVRRIAASEVDLGYQTLIRPTDVTFERRSAYVGLVEMLVARDAQEKISWAAPVD